MRSWLLTSCLAVSMAGYAACDARPGSPLDGSSGGGGLPGTGARPGSGGSPPLGHDDAGAGDASGGSTGGAGGSAAGGADGGADEGRPGVDPDGPAACAALARALCGQAETCTPFAIGLVFGTRAVCEERLVVDCLTRFASGSNETAADTMSCAESLASHPCSEFVRGDLGVACAPRPGALQAGAVCVDDRQCDTTFCARAPDSLCGVCAAVTPPGSPCVRGACSTGAVCPKGTSTCLAPVAGPIGAVCSVNEQCDVGHGVACSPVSGHCIGLTLSSGGTCGLDVAKNSYGACGASGTCSTLVAGRCAPAAPDGAACSAGAAGPTCLPPARCVDGRCRTPAPDSCPL